MRRRKLGRFAQPHGVTKAATPRRFCPRITLVQQAQPALQIVIVQHSKRHMLRLHIFPKAVAPFFIFPVRMNIGIVEISRQLVPGLAQQAQRHNAARSAATMQQKLHIISPASGLSNRLTCAA